VLLLPGLRKRETIVHFIAHDSVTTTTLHPSIFEQIADNLTVAGIFSVIGLVLGIIIAK
jgi:hypothetical protein